MIRMHPSIWHHGVEHIQWEDCDEQHTVYNRQTLEQELCRCLHLVLPEHNETQTITNEAENTDEANDEGFYDQVIQQAACQLITILGVSSCVCQA